MNGALKAFLSETARVDIAHDVVAENADPAQLRLGAFEHSSSVAVACNNRMACFTYRADVNEACVLGQPSLRIGQHVMPDWTADPDTSRVAEIFDDMAGEYDNLKDRWYRHTLGFIDDVLSRHFEPSRDGCSPRALDVGCGTGIQSLRLAQLGYKVDGIDISPRLIEVAKQKAIARNLEQCCFRIADARQIPFPDSAFDVVNCCGSTLSFVNEWMVALEEMSRCLKPGGRLLLEVEGKWNLDLIWGVVSALMSDVFGYHMDLPTAIAGFRRPWRIGHFITYAFKKESGGVVFMRLKTFTPHELMCALEKNRLRCTRRWGLHSVTNLIPSPLLHSAEPGQLSRCTFSLLAALDRFVACLPLFRSFRCSLLLIAEKEGSSGILVGRNAVPSNPYPLRRNGGEGIACAATVSRNAAFSQILQHPLAGCAGLDSPSPPPRGRGRGEGVDEGEADDLPTVRPLAHEVPGRTKKNEECLCSIHSR